MKALAGVIRYRRAKGTMAYVAERDGLTVLVWRIRDGWATGIPEGSDHRPGRAVAGTYMEHFGVSRDVAAGYRLNTLARERPS